MIGSVAALTRYPVKSLVGEDVAAARVDLRAIEGDRLWAVRDEDGRLGSGKSTRRFRRMDGLLDLRAQYAGATPTIAWPDGTLLRGDDERVHAALSEHVGRAVTLAAEGPVAHHDEGPLHLVTTSSLAALADAHGGAVDRRRLRPNLVVDTGGAPGPVESGWAGTTLRVGPEVVVRVRGGMPRCVMVELPQAALAAQPGLLGTLGERFGLELGVVLDVLQPGTVRVGDLVSLA